MSTSVGDELYKLFKLKEAGVLSEEEFEVQRARLLGNDASPGSSAPPARRNQPPRRGRRPPWLILAVLGLLVSPFVAAGVEWATGHEAAGIVLIIMAIVALVIFGIGKVTEDSQSRGAVIAGAIGAAVVVVIGVAIVLSLYGPAPNFRARVSSVTALSPSEVRVYYVITNTGKAAGTANCVLTTDSQNQFGDQHTNVNSTGTNGNIKPGKSQQLYQDVGVPNGNASSVTRSDVTITDCSS